MVRMVDKNAVTALLDEFSVEVTPASAAKVERFADYLAPGTTVNVTFLPGSDIADTVAVAARLRGEGFNPVPHIAARSLESEGQLAAYLDALQDRAAVEEVLVIGGGVDRPLGPYASTMPVLTSGLLERAGIKRVGVAGHPEGSPDIPDHEIARALADKNAWAETCDLAVHIETQFCFEAAAILGWERRIREAGNRLPIHIGLPGIATLKTLVKFAQLSGVGPSIRVLTRQTRNIAKLLTVQDPNQVVAELAGAVAADPDCLIERVHFYPFGGLAKTAAWARAVAAGHIRPTRNGFEVEETHLQAVS